MRKDREYLNLHLFDGEGAASGAAAGTGADGSEGNTGGEAMQDAAAERAGDESQEQSDAGTGTDETTHEENFDDLIRGKYKEDFDQRVNRIIGKRFREMKGLQETNQKLQNIVDVMGARYKTENPDEIYQKMQSDDTLYEDAALSMGMTVDQYKEYSNTIAENNRLRAERQQVAEQQEIQRIADGWRAEGEKLKSMYPGFDFDEEIRNPEIRQLLTVPGHPISLETAFNAVHHDEILAGTLRFAVDKTRKSTADTIAAKGRRPVENGATNRQGAKMRVDVSKLTSAQMDEYIARARRGEKITFQ